MLRQRKKDDKGLLPQSFVDDKLSRTTCSGFYKISTFLPVIIIVCSWVILYSMAFYLNHHLPSIVKSSDEISHDRFVGERAKNLLIKIAQAGIKVPGSYELEMRAVDLLENEIKSIILNANSLNRISFDKQKSAGSYYLAQKIGFLSVYDDVVNLIVKIGPSNDSNLPSLLVNCHYDSAPSSPGASDDGLNCAVMMEVLRVLSHQNFTLQSNIIFLFNGAEETPLQASHGFIVHHKWAKSVKAFINLESCGAGGKETLFQTGPQHPWLVQLYKKAVQHPFGLVLAEDLFQGGLVPSDTDFRIFRDFGHIPGLDFAHCDNGYVYHTRFDNVDNIRDGVYQHTGDNLLALVRLITSSKMLHDPEQYKEGRMVYFDLGGLYFIAYSETFGKILNWATVILSVFIFAQNVFTYTAGLQKKEVIKQFGMSVLIPVTGLCLAILFVVLIAVLLDTFNSVLSWYSKPYLILPLYFLPTLIAFSLPPLLINKTVSSNLCDGVRAQLYCNGFQLLWTVGLFVAILTGLRSAYVLLIAVIVTALTNCLLSLASLQHDVMQWLVRYCSCTVIPALYFVYLYLLATKLFIPIAGRSGPNINPELLIGVLAALLCSLIYGYITPLIILVWKPWRLIYGLLLVNLITIFLVIATPFGFPFAEDTPQRLVVLHTARSFHNESGDVVKSDSGMWLMHVDRRAPKTYDAIPWFKDVKNIDSDCQKYLYCGLPFYYTRIANLNKNPGSWVPMHPPSLKSDISVTLHNIDDITSNVKRFNFTLRGPHQMLIFLSPQEGVELLSWSLEEDTPVKNLEWGNRSTFIIRFTAGGYPGDPTLSFFIDLQVNSEFKNLISYLDFAVAGHYIEDMKNQEKELMKSYPITFIKWAHVTTWSAAYKSYVF